MSQVNVQIVRSICEAWADRATSGLSLRARPTRFRWFSEATEALEAVGLSEQDAHAEDSDGRGGFRTCDLSRVKRALSH
jgi:hypothetical protein